jgi:SecD/SecF fusion protein
MKNKGLVIGLTLVITLLSVYYLSFTFAARTVQKEATEHATDKQGIVNLSKKQSYLDSVWNLPVHNFFGARYTYKEVKDNELSLGLDLQGGMHVTLEVSSIDIVRGLSNNSEEPGFLAALKTARQKQKENNENFSDIFFEEYRKTNPDKPLSRIFANSITKGRLAGDASDNEVIEFINNEIEQSIERSFTILRNRIDQFGTSQPNIQRLPGTGRIQIEIPGADNPQRVRKLLQGIAKLEFFDVVEPSSISGALMQINAAIQADTRQLASSDKKEEQGSDLSTLLGDSTETAGDTTDSGTGLDSLQTSMQADLFSKSIPPGTFRYNVKDTAWLNQYFRRDEIRNLLPRNVSVYWSNKPVVTETGAEVLELHFLDMGRNGKARLTGEVITEAISSIGETGSPSVTMRMNASGTRAWAKWTAEAAAKSPKGRIAIVLDKNVYSAPVVNGEIPNGNSQIEGNFTTEEARDLANILKAGSLPAPTQIVEEAIIGPTLGKVAQSQGFISIICGLVLVVLFMIAYYGRPGAVANLALIFNLVFILGILAQLDASLTLPGIAGIVLTMGMAVDANVIIYERVREELRRGKRLREAISLGFKRSFWTIFDSNITTFLTALMLYVFGQGPVKGFAVTLMVGIVTTFFTAVYISRVVLEWMVARNLDESKLSFQTVISKFDASVLNIDFLGKRRIAYLFSSIIIGIGIILIVLQGLNLGVDFTGGRTFVVNFNEPVVATDMKVALSESFDNTGTDVKNYGGNNVVKVTTSYLINDDSEDADEKVRAALVSGIEEFSGMRHAPDRELSDKEFSIVSSSKVGATIADDIKIASVNSALLSLVVIFLYILIRFRAWQFSSGAIVSLAHDALFVFSAFAIARLFGIAFEVDQVFIAAILTVIGYSINDTVIIFDRIREYVRLGTSHDRAKIFNDALNSTLNRTLITSGTTLLVVLALFIFGGEVLRGFSFALLVGIGIGTYSSVFIAAPVVLDFGSSSAEDVKSKKVETTKAQTVQNPWK